MFSWQQDGSRKVGIETKKAHTHVFTYSQVSFTFYCSFDSRLCSIHSQILWLSQSTSWFQATWKYSKGGAWHHLPHCCCRSSSRSLVDVLCLLIIDDECDSDYRYVSFCTLEWLWIVNHWEKLEVKQSLIRKMENDGAWEFKNRVVGMYAFIWPMKHIQLRRHVLLCKATKMTAISVADSLIHAQTCKPYEWKHLKTWKTLGWCNLKYHVLVQSSSSWVWFRW